MCKLILEKLSLIEKAGVRDKDKNFRPPKLPKINFNEKEECHKLIIELENFIDTRSELLKDVGVKIKKSALSKDHIRYRFEYKGKLTYFFNFWTEMEFGHQKIGFFDGWNENSAFNQKSYTAMIYLHSDANISRPIIEIQNFSLLNIIPSFKNITKDDLLQGIWEKIVTTIEQIVPQLR